MNKLLILLLFLLPSISMGDDAFLGSMGGNVFPIIRNMNIKMSKEEIRIKMLKDSCNVTCKFWFKNESKDTVSVLMGFPDFFYVHDEYHSLALRNFTCKVNGNNTAFIRRKQVTTPPIEVITNNSNSSDTKYWFCWDVWNIKPHETILVENGYTGDYGGSVNGNYSFSYLLGTAQTWFGTIGEGKIIFDYSEIASSLFLDTTGYYESNIFDKKMKEEIYDDSTVFQFHDYYPRWIETIGISLYPYWKPTYFTIPDTSSSYFFAGSNIEKYSKLQLRLMKNEIYARHGYVFKDENLKKKFAEKSWYKPDESFTENRLSNYERVFIKYLLSIEKKTPDKK